VQLGLVQLGLVQLGLVQLGLVQLGLVQLSLAPTARRRHGANPANFQYAGIHTCAEQIQITNLRANASIRFREVRVKPNSIVISAVILAAVALSMHSQSAPAAPAPGPSRIAVVAMREAMLATQDGRKAVAAMQARFEPRRLDLEKRQADLKALDDRSRTGAATMSADTQKRLADEIAVKKKALDRDSQDLDDDAQQEDGKLMQDIGEKMGTVIDQYGKQKGYTVVVDAAQPILWAAESANVTLDIIKLYDQQHPGAAPLPAK
jgi:outer membrane protein